MFTKKIIPGLITGIFCFSQIANASSAVKNEMAIVQLDSQLQALNTEEGLAQLDQGLNEISVNYATLEVSDANEKSETESGSYQKKKNRWSHILNKRIPGILNSANAKLDVPNETLQANIAVELKKAQEKQNQNLISYYTSLMAIPADQLKPSIMAHNETALNEGSEYLSTRIAERGGIVPFVAHLRGEIAQAKLSLKAKKQGRSLASDDPHSVLWKVLMTTAVFAIFGLGCFIAAISATEGGFLAAIFIAIAIDTVFIKVTGVGRRY